MADTIKYPGLELFKHWGEWMQKIVGDNYSFGVSSEIANNKKAFARMFVMGNTSGQMDLQNNEISTHLAVQCDSFSTVGLQEAFEIDAVSHQAMVDMGFYRTYGADITERADSKIKRVTSRYRRVYTGYLPHEANQYDIAKDTDGDFVLDSENKYIITTHKED